MTGFDVTSLYSGCGGMDIGFHDAGYRIRAAYDKDPDATSCYNANLNSTALQLDVLEHPNELPRNPVLIAGPPCQGFSTASGYRKDDDRNNLLVYTCKLAARLKPDLVMIENVAALSNVKNQGFLNSATRTLRDAGYHVESRVFSADTFGVAQRRKRIIIVGRSRNRHFDFANLRPGKTGVTVKDALSGVSDVLDSHNPYVAKISTKNIMIAKRIGPGQKLCNVRRGENSVHTWEIPEVFGRTNAKERIVLAGVQKLRRTKRKRSYGDADPVSIDAINEHFQTDMSAQVDRLLEKGYLRWVDSDVDLTNTFNGKFRRLSWDDVSPTVDTRFGDMELFLHPDENRSMTVREAARIQGFRDNFVFPLQKRSAFRLIGNAVPPPMAFELAKFLRDLV